jgi:methionine-rich copper-binding protein CopC
MIRRTWVLLTAALALLLATQAAAHTELERAVPAAGSTVAVSPARLSLWFSQRLEPAFSTVQVLDPEGRQIDKGDSQVDSADPREIHVSLPGLNAGTYHVLWRVLSTDSHVNEGDFTFDVRP